ncbi:IncV family inclusion membrane protein [Chlamydia trachomatis]|uniref:Putative membrane protein n=1 Tax=Chlamydia trachomatis serovar L2b (strain UCH-1/proctitis) TaxID=471473 RepID=A0A6H2W114_CHLTB|nr:IncV family inclusion membrane protein [Chlamydia trachomatis]AGR95266.1 hypothetical protein CTRC852_00030 [Chlamydia trachomatis RC-F(s)/852]AGR98985.1 hypothetical protein CTRC342_00030 [Chlamydia trachomatis RC-F(s)/342]AGT71416.1 hypothetical protein O179_00030 [Chlamydia trachomatis]AKC30245.1 hypothetical protein L2bCS78408_01395 [Chlamydia trachomatis]AKC31155.1 hypothetical protein L2bCS1908_01395 [Chlamydia trachomatis]
MTPVTPVPPQSPQQVKGLLSRFLTAPDRHPKLRYVYDIALIAISILCIVSIILWTQGSGLALFAIAPALAIGALGVTLLVSDLAESQKSKEIADTVAAVSLPFILTGTAAGLMFSAIAVGGGAVILANPLFLMGSMTLGFALMSLHRVTYQYLSNREQWKQQKKLEQVELAAWESHLPKESKSSALEEVRYSPRLMKRGKTWRKRAIRRKNYTPIPLVDKTLQTMQPDALFSSTTTHSTDSEQILTSVSPQSSDTESSSSSSFHTPPNSDKELSDSNSSDSSSSSEYMDALETVAAGDVSGITPPSKPSSSPKTTRRVVKLSRSERNAQHHRNKDQEQRQDSSESSDEESSSDSSQKKKPSRK